MGASLCVGVPVRDRVSVRVCFSFSILPIFVNVFLIGAGACLYGLVVLVCFLWHCFVCHVVSGSCMMIPSFDPSLSLSVLRRSGQAGGVIGSGAHRSSHLPCKHGKDPPSWLGLPFPWKQGSCFWFSVVSLQLVPEE